MRPVSTGVLATILQLSGNHCLHFRLDSGMSSQPLMTLLAVVRELAWAVRLAFSTLLRFRVPD